MVAVPGYLTARQLFQFLIGRLDTLQKIYFALAGIGFNSS